jgi:epoxide hydrolase
VNEFQVRWTDEEIEDLRERLRRTRWPEAETVDDWSQGVPLAYAQELCRYWAEEYDFAAAQARLNAFPQFRTEIDGLGLHFLHVRSPHEGALPLLLTHGWPGSIVEFLDVIRPLTEPDDPADAFHVVAPSLPGYGFSDKPTSPGWKVPRIARAEDELMRTLGYERYGAQGGDWGAMVTTSLGQQIPTDRLVGIHLNMATVGPDPETFGDLTPTEQKVLEDLADHARWGMGYSSEQSTRPQTLGYGLADSPAGQCAWIAEKFWAWTDCGGHPEGALTKDQMLDNISVYWFSSTAASSARLYWESFHEMDQAPVELPVGMTIFPREIIRPSRRWAEKRFTDIRHYAEAPKGGHFAAFEQPATFVDEVRSFFRLVR